MLLITFVVSMRMICEKGEVNKKIVDFFKNLLQGSRKTLNREVIDKHIDYKIVEDQTMDIIKDVTSKEVRKILFVMNNNKALRPNGFGALFFFW